MEKLLMAWGQSTIVMSFLIICFLLLQPWLSNKRKYSAKWLYYTWLVIVIGLLIPFRPQIASPLIAFEQPASSAKAGQHDIWSPPFASGIAVGAEAAGGAAADGTAELARPNGASLLASVDWYQAASYVWIAGAVIFLLFHVINHRKFMSLVKRWSSRITDHAMLEILAQQQAEMKISQPVTLKACPFIASPMMIGFVRPVILLPVHTFTPDELRFIFKHELIHWRRSDLWYKIAVLAATAIHWFNPFVHLMARAIAIQCEKACDEAVLAHTGIENRKLYGAMILGVIRKQTSSKTAFSTTFYGGRKEMKNRLSAILDSGKKRKSIVLPCCVLLGTLVSGAVFAENEEAERQSGQSELAARHFASDRMSGATTYSVGMEAGEAEYDYEKLLGANWKEMTVAQVEAKLEQAEAEQMEKIKKSAELEGVSISSSYVDRAQSGLSTAFSVFKKDAKGIEHEIMLELAYEEEIKDKNSITMKEKERIFTRSFHDIKKMITDKSYDALSQRDLARKLQAELVQMAAKAKQAGANMTINYEIVSYAIDGRTYYQKYEDVLQQEQSPKQWAAQHSFQYVKLDIRVSDMSREEAAQFEHELHVKYRGKNMIVELNDFVYDLRAEDVVHFSSYSSARNRDFIVKVEAKYTIFDQVKVEELSEQQVDDTVNGVLAGKQYKSAADLQSDMIKALADKFGVDASYFVVNVIHS
ncbi:M56 family metallopeptidase [Paenibacillus sp. GCM10027626]|uniref:M56 family metallopeptidase n=1 Tax=Paenibacillus sp. GCM10027626 TaxID=3273411 RepID=UPI00363B7579